MKKLKRGDMIAVSVSASAAIPGVGLMVATFQTKDGRRFVLPVPLDGKPVDVPEDAVLESVGLAPQPVSGGLVFKLDWLPCDSGGPGGRRRIRTSARRNVTSG